eukprot:SAG11_NODE_7056_length_1201_cov_1.559891_1_plen_76_part_00
MKQEAAEKAAEQERKDQAREDKLAREAEERKRLQAEKDAENEQRMREVCARNMLPCTCCLQCHRTKAVRLVPSRA